MNKIKTLDDFKPYAKIEVKIGNQWVEGVKDYGENKMGITRNCPLIAAGSHMGDLTEFIPLSGQTPARLVDE